VRLGQSVTTKCGRTDRARGIAVGDEMRVRLSLVLEDPPIDAIEIAECAALLACIAGLLVVEGMLRRTLTRLRLRKADEGPPEAAHEPGSAGADATANVDAGSAAGDAQVPSELISLPELTPAQERAVKELGDRAAALDLVAAHQAAAAYARDHRNLARYVLARVRGAGAEPDVDASLRLLEKSLAWRVATKPHEILPAHVAAEALTGKGYVAGFDAHRRPVLVLDNDKENHAGGEEGALRYLAFNLEYAARLLASAPPGPGPAPDRFVVFIKLGDFRLSTMPPLRVTLATISMVVDCFPERLGQCVLYQPPAAFASLWRVARHVLPAATLAKVVFVRGDVRPGSDNDRMLARAVGPRWRELTGAERPVYKAGCSPGFDVDVYWPSVVADGERWARGDQLKGPVWPLGPGPSAEDE